MYRRCIICIVLWTAGIFLQDSWQGLILRVSCMDSSSVLTLRKEGGGLNPVIEGRLFKNVVALLLEEQLLDRLPLASEFRPSRWHSLSRTTRRTTTCTK